MPQPDIILPITADPNGPKALVWIESIEITRQGAKPISGVPQMEDRWRISLPVRASLADAAGELVLDKDGAEIATKPPIPSVSYDVADLLHDEQVSRVMADLRDLAIRLASGDLKPQVAP